jgi:hypothetical protein
MPARGLYRDGSLQNVEGFILEAVNMRRRASSGTRHSLNYETAPARFRACDEEGYPVARSPIHRACSRGYILNLILILHGFDFFHGFYVYFFICLE